MEFSSSHTNKIQDTSSWNSKGSLSTISSSGAIGVRPPYSRRCRTSNSMLSSSDSDIRFTRKKLSSGVKCGCCIIASFLIFLLLLSVFIYLTYAYIIQDVQSNQIFRGRFRIVEGDKFRNSLIDTNSTEFKNSSNDYQIKLSMIYENSIYSSSFISSEILALDGEEGKDLAVHFNLIFDRRINQDIYSENLVKILKNNQKQYFKHKSIDPNSIEIFEHFVPVDATPAPQTTIITTEPPPKPRECVRIDLDYCKHLPYNFTSYPNYFDHSSLAELQNHLISFRELVDSECYRNAYEFLCELLQPKCIHLFEKNDVVKPCRTFCRDFISGCGDRLSDSLKSILDCSKFPEFHGFNSCSTRPGCIQSMHGSGLSSRLCDGIMDCEDGTDETTCSYCPTGYIHCGIGRKCIRSINQCDGKQDCPDNSDERYCLSLSENLNKIKEIKSVSSHQAKYSSEGHVIFNEKGQYGKLCVDNLVINQTDERIIKSTAKSLCKSLTYSSLEDVRVEKDYDKDKDNAYVKMKNPYHDEITFVRTTCQHRNVLYINCSNLECGLQPAHENFGTKGFPKMATHGHWPWHVALFKEDIHVCDATLISSEWLITTASCFQGQPKAEWLAKLGIVRLNSFSPWQQIRRIVGMVKSPVEGSTIVMVKMEEPVVMNDFIRPICLPKMSEKIGEKSQCDTLGWSKNWSHLERIQIELTDMQKCENISISTVNSLCTDSPYQQNDCEEEEFAGSPLFCLQSDEKHWAIVGISNWRIACTKRGLERPRMYDKISSNVQWIQKIISNSP